MGFSCCKSTKIAFHFSTSSSESSKLEFKATSTRFKLCKYSVKMKKKLSISCSSWIFFNESKKWVLYCFSSIIFKLISSSSKLHNYCVLYFPLEHKYFQILFFCKVFELLS